MIAMGGMSWHDGKFTYNEYWLRGADRENDLKLALQQIKQDADRYHYKGKGQRIVSLTTEKGKDEITIKVKLEATERKRRKRKRP
jgi:hypothetical protein